ncbi:MAG: DnaJ domain-containing protein [Leptolyngbyaceae cyanobacterium]
MNIEKGLFQFDLTDYHAILGVSLDADAKTIRKRYLKIARKLHPDSLRSGTEADRQRANELLSKLVNPAYETLTQEKAMVEHKIVLRMRGEQLNRQQTVAFESAAAKAIVGSSNAAPMYTNQLKELADAQYESLESVLEVTGQISELNLAYLMTTASPNGGATAASATAAPASGESSATAGETATAESSQPKAAATPPPAPRRRRESIMDSYLNRAAEFALRKNYSQAILEVREAVKSQPQNGRCHGQLAAYYFEAGQTKMAKIHLKRAIELNYSGDLVTELEAKLNKSTAKQADQNSAKKAPAKSKGGLFGLFGGKQNK